MDPYAMQEKLDRGYMNCMVIINIVGTPQKHVEDTLGVVIKRLKEEKDIDVIEETVHPATESDNFFSAFAEVNLLLKDFAALNKVCFIYLPSSIEFIKPENFRLPSREMGNFVNDLLSMMHESDLKVKSTNAANNILEKNLRNLLKNSLLNSLDSGKKPVEELSKAVGITPEQLAPFLEEFSKEGLIRKQEDGWERVQRL